MVDPFSVASGAAGVVSLGLTVCQGLLAYYGPFKAFSSETETFVTRVKGLSAILELLQAKYNKLQNPPSPHILDELQLVSDRLNECGEALQQLSNVLSKCRGYDAGGILTEKGRAFAKALYPFRRGTLVGLTDVVAGVQSNLEVALQVLMLAITGQLEQRSILSLSVSHSIASNIAGVPSSLERLDTGQQRLMQSQEQMLQLVTRMQHMQLVASDRTFDPPQEHVVRHLPSAGSGHQQGWHQKRVPNLPRLDLSTRRKVKCTCGGTRSWSSRIFGLVSSIRSHRYDCPLFQCREVATLVGGKFTILTRYINYSASFHVAVVHEKTTFSIQPIITFRRVVNWDSPAFESIKNLFFSGDRDYREVLLRLRRLFDEGKASPSDTLPDDRTLVHEAIRYLLQIPYGEVPSFEEFVSELVVQFHVPVNGSLYKHTPLDLLILSSDEASFGTYAVDGPLIRPRMSRFFPAADVAHARLATVLLNNGATVTLDSPPDLTPRSWRDGSSIVFSYCEEGWQNDYLVGMVKLCGIEEFPFSQLMKAILSRSENALESVLQISDLRDVLDDVHSHRYVVAWPPGVILMLKYFPTHLAPRLMRSAITEVQVHSLEILLRHCICRITHYDVFLAADPKFYDPAIFEELVSAFAAQMQNLKALAATYLPLPESQSLGARYSMTLLDSEACKVQKLLCESGCPLGLDMCYHGDLRGENMQMRSVYHGLCNSQAAEILYKEGFTNVDEFNTDNQSPLRFLRPHFWSGGLGSLINYLKMCEWLLDHGALLYGKSREPSLQPLYSIAHLVGEGIWAPWVSPWHDNTYDGYVQLDPIRALRIWSDTMSLVERVISNWLAVFTWHSGLMQTLLGNYKHHDSCVCACSNSGCLPLNIFLSSAFDTLLTKHFAEYHESHDNTRRYRQLYPEKSNGLLLPVNKPAAFAAFISASILDPLLNSSARRLGHLEESFAPTIIRTCTFNILGLTHTCRGHDPDNWEKGKVSVAEVPIIQEEERFLIALVENLVAEFVRKYEEQQVALADFLKNYWVHRMNEVLKEEDVFDEQEAARMREVGVVVKIPQETTYAISEIDEDEEDEEDEHI